MSEGDRTVAANELECFRDLVPGLPSECGIYVLSVSGDDSDPDGVTYGWHRVWRTTSGVLETDALPARGEHDWHERFGLTCCRRCGRVKRRDGENKPCPGQVKVTPRGREALRQIEEARDANQPGE